MDSRSLAERYTVADALPKLVRLVAEGEARSFRELALAAGLEPRTDFVGSSLQDLDFRGENLQGFDFTDADLTGCDFRRARISGVRFTRADLTGVIGLPDKIVEGANAESDGCVRDPSRIFCAFEIVNRQGLDARPAALVVQTVEMFDTIVRVSRGTETVDGTSIMGLMMLAAGPGTLIFVQATGREAAEAVYALEELIVAGFYESEGFRKPKNM
jgi:phosphocarrier protein HPr